MRLKPGEPPLPFGQHLRPFSWKEGLLIIPTVKIEPGVPTGIDLVLTIQALLHINVVEQSPNGQSEMLRGPIHGVNTGISPLLPLSR